MIRPTSQTSIHERIAPRPRIDRKRFARLCAVVLLLAGGAIPLAGQETSSEADSRGQIRPPPPQIPENLRQRIQIPPPPGNPANLEGGAPSVEEDPYWRETVESAISQYREGKPEERRSAVMLLGKYPVPPAQSVLAEALEDPSADVRQAALVSVLEEQMRIDPMFHDKLLPMLGDPAVSIRRIASSSLPMIISSYPFSVQGPAGHVQRRLPEDSTDIILRAFRDEDASVRRNMVNSYAILRIPLPEETLVALLHDPDLQVAIHALRWALPLLPAPAFDREIRRLAKHDAPAFRLELARTLQGQPGIRSAEALKLLQADANPAVALEALLGIFQQERSVAVYQKMVDLYQQSGGADDIGRRIVFSAQLLDEQAEPFLRDWIEQDDPALRQQALQVYLSRFATDIEIDFLLTLIEDPVREVRQQAARAMMQASRRLTIDHVRQAAASRHIDVRRLAPDLTRTLSDADAESILLDLLLDNERDVRIATLRQIGQRRIDGWEEILGISLRVNDPLISRTALEALLREPTSGAIEILRTYRQETPRSPWAPQIDAFLQRLNAASAPGPS